MNRNRVVLAVLIGSLGLASLATAGSPDPERQIVVYKDAARARKTIEAAGGKVIRELGELDAFAVKVPARALARLRADASIALVEADAPRYPLSIQAPSPTGSQVRPWGTLAVNADPFHGDTEVPICIIDSGYAKPHEDLQTKHVTASPDPGTGSPWTDACGHGTHVAGTISAFDDQIGVVGVNGNGEVPMHIVKVFGDDCAYAYSSDLAAAVGKCVTEGHARIISMSLGGGTPSQVEKKALDQALEKGVLSIAAAGNDGNSKKSYPAAYDSVMSVAAVDSALDHAEFSQFNDDVEIAGPGVAVRSTYIKGKGTEVELEDIDDAYHLEAAPFVGSAEGDVTAPMFRCNAVDGLGSPGDCAGAEGKLCLIERGEISFAFKVQECQRKGGVAAVIFNSSDALFTGTLEGQGVTIKIPAVSVAGNQAAYLEGAAGTEFQVRVLRNGNYEFLDGTSMATPHVSGVAAAVWSHDPSCKARDIRALLAFTAHDIDSPGRDVNTGYGLVDYAAALEKLDCDGKQEACTLGKSGAACTSMSECCSGTCQSKNGKKTCR
ncbi:MAG: S8 family serine peptidase [Deltaproteobacteria bacterium]|jgi:serine protease|nr:S8 family serine peptidase [Deltaproteobacteria bacterium]